MFLYLCQTLAYLWKCVNSLVFHKRWKKGTGNCFKSQFRCLFVRICLLSFYFSLNYLLPDCYVLRTPTILPQYSHIVKLTLHFFAHIVGVSQGHFPIIVQAKVRKDLWTMQSRTKKVHKLFTKLFLEKCWQSGWGVVTLTQIKY